VGGRQRLQEVQGPRAAPDTVKKSAGHTKGKCRFIEGASYPNHESCIVLIAGNDRFALFNIKRDIPHARDESYLPFIDGLRAIAVLAVVGSHVSDSRLPGGYIGVDIFFVLSGYLITGILLRDHAAGRASLTRFYSRRIRRIFPALLLTVSVTWLVGWALLFDFEFEALGRQVAAGIAFLANVALWQEAGYFDSEATMKPLLHLWSLGVEEHFYLAWPPLLWLACGMQRPLAFAGTILLVSLALNLSLLSSAPISTFYLAHTRVWELLLGALLAILQSRPITPLARDYSRSRQLWQQYGSDLKVLCALFMLVVPMFAFGRNDPYPGWRALIPTLGTLLILSAGSRAWLNRTVLAYPALVFVGLISYPLYLWHWPLLYLTRISTATTPSVAARLLAMLVAVGLAWLTYRFLEQPIRKSGGDRSVVALLVIAAGIGALGVSSWYGIGPRPRLDHLSAELAEFAPQKEDAHSSPACAKSMPFPTHYCRIVPVGHPPSVALIGDSHSDHIVPGLAEFLSASNRSLINLGSNGCIPLWTGWSNDPEMQRCARLIEPALSFALADRHVDTVILAAAWANRIKTLGEQKFAEDLRQAVSRFVAAGKRVIFFHDVPDLGFHPLNCLNMKRIFSGPVEIDCKVERRRAETLQAAYRRIVSKVIARFPNVTDFDPFPTFCDKLYCRAFVDGRFLYVDSNHLSLTGALLLRDAYHTGLTVW